MMKGGKRLAMLYLEPALGNKPNPVEWQSSAETKLAKLNPAELKYFGGVEIAPSTSAARLLAKTEPCQQS